jgi:hypothetical protein
MSSIPVLTLGWILLLVGIVGLFLPLLPGIPTLIAALAVLSRKYKWAQQLLERARQCFPMLANKAQQLWRSAGVRLGRALRRTAPITQIAGSRRKNDEHSASSQES